MNLIKRIRRKNDINNEIILYFELNIISKLQQFLNLVLIFEKKYIIIIIILNLILR